MRVARPGAAYARRLGSAAARRKASAGEPASGVGLDAGRPGAGGQRARSLADRLDPRRNSLNFLRLLLATTVIVSHAYPLGGFRAGHEPLFAGHNPGWYAVAGFFALSGYLITGSRMSNALGSFVRRRVLRLYPGYLVCMAATVLLFAPLGYLKVHGSLHGYATTGVTPLDYLANNLALRYHGSAIAGTPLNHHGWTPTHWTLYYEFLCYLVVGLLALWASFRRKPFVSIGLLAALTLVHLGQGEFRHFVHNADVLHMVDLLPFFLGGVIAYQVRDRIPCRWWMTVASLAVSAFVPLVLGSRFLVLDAVPLAVFLLTLGALLPIGLGRRNDVSYGVYLYSGPVQQLLTFGGLNRHGIVLYILVSVVVTIPFAVASWFLIERPTMRWGRRRVPVLTALTPVAKARTGSLAGGNGAGQL